MEGSWFSRRLTHLKEEVIGVIPAIIYFAIAFNLIYFTVGLTLDPGEVRHFTPLAVTLGALIVGKVLIVANAFPFINAFPHKPLIYNIVWKFFIYICCLFIFWVIEASIHLGRKYDDLHAVGRHLHAEIFSVDFWASFLWVVSVFFIFVVANEFIRVLGKKQVMQILFGSKN